MSYKALITADIHIGDYKNYNQSPDWRLKEQNERLARRLIEMAEENECSEIWILGDFLRLPVSSNKVNHMLFNFVAELQKSYTVKFILGNHDTSSKSQEQRAEDSIISLLEEERIRADDMIFNHGFEYMDHQHITVSNNHYFFMDWRPVQDWSWTEPLIQKGEKVIYLGHYTHAPKGAMWESQKIIGPTPDLFIFGDIHKHYTEDNFMSIGVPVQNNLGDEAEGHCVVLDLETSEAKHVEVDPDHSRFLQMRYTDLKEEEGFTDNGLTYLVYKPKIKKAEKEDREGLKWDTVEDLISSVVLKEGLTKIHSKILSQNPKYDEIDFNFKLVSLHVQGFRSLVDIEIPFDGNKEILVLCGDNGSGKSSIIKALTSMFRKNRYLKEDRSDLCKEFRISLKLTYQNKLYEIVKGENSNMGFFIDGTEQHYSGIPQMEADIMEKLPFMEYLDMMFLDSDTPNLEDKLTDDRRIKLIRKFYRLDRLTAYHDLALELYEELHGEVQTDELQRSLWTSTKDDLEKDLEALREELSGYPSHQKILEEIRELSLAEAKNKIWDTWQRKHVELQSKKEMYIQQRDSNVSCGSELSDILATLAKKTDEKTQLGEQVLEAKTNISERNIIRATLESLSDHESDFKADIEELSNEVCPRCGQRISTEASKKMIDDLKAKLEDTIEKKQGFISRLEYLEQHTANLAELEDKEKDLRLEIRDLNAQVAEIKSGVKLYSDACAGLEKVEADLKDLGEEPENVQVDIPYLTKLITMSQQYETLNTKRDELSKLNIKIEELDTKLKSKLEMIDQYKKYIDAMSDTGVVMAEILRELAYKFNETSSEVTYDVNTGVYRNKPFIEFLQYYDVRGHKREYSSLSSGQKTICDMDFLYRLFVNQVGMLIMDESFKYVDTENFQSLQSHLKMLNVNTIIVSTHDPNFSAYTRRYYLTLDDNGATILNE